ncbi:MAG TPA: ATP-binding protein, partial [Caulobacteraceae bacterium]|nr:ATP-binding protein [Caulobacteraceae bacterium]
RVAAARHARDLLLDEGGVETWHYDPDDESYLFSPELVVDYGLEPPRVSGAVFDSLRHPADLATERQVRERLVREGGAEEITLRVRELDDSVWRQVRVDLLAGRQVASGRYEVWGHTSAVSDIAKARNEARSNTEFLEMALSAAHAGVFEVDHVAQTFRCSPEFINIVGRPLTYEEGRNASWPELPAEDIAALAQMQGRWGAPGHLSVDVRGGRDGRWIRFYCKVARDETGVGLGAVGLVLDIEDAKRQELALIAAQKAAEAATESKSRFLASVSHEIRTPMNGIVGVLHLLKGENITDEGRGLLEEALACSGMLSQLINDVLDISKIEAGMLELDPEPSRLADALEGVTGLLAPQAEAKGLYLRTVVAPDLGWAMVDDVRLRQCLFNLIGNAVKFTLKGGVEVRMVRAGEGRLRVEVEDTGIGIPPEARERLFQRFVQADDTTTRNFSGTGLGLTIARSLAQMMGGDIGFTSREGEGSTFWMEIAAPTAAPARAQAASDLSLDGLCILLVDDNATNRLVGGKILEALGAAVSLSDSGADAVERAGREAFDLILMDISMPGMDGLEATRRIRALPGAPSAIPIVALTANVMADQQRSYLAAGMNGVVPKPLSPSALLAEILRLAGAPDEVAPDQAAA